MSLLLWACSTEENEDLNLDLDLPSYPSDTVQFKDISLQTFRADGSRTDNLDFTVLGQMHDSMLGSTQAAFYTQIGLNGIANIPANAVLDSMVFNMRYIGGYGNNDYPLDITISELDEVLYSDSQYTNLSNVAVGTELARIDNFTFHSNRAGIRFRIDDYWLNNDLFAGKTYSNNDEFQKAIKGFAVEVSPNNNLEKDGFLAYFSPSNPESEVVVYFTYEADNGVDIETQISFDFVSQVKRFSRIEHLYQNAPVAAYLSEDSTSANRAFVQALGGLYTKISIKEQVKALSEKGNVALHHAELLLPCDCGLHSSYFPPVRFLDLKTRGDNGGLVDVLDRSNFSWSRSYDGIQNRFRYLITSEIQFMLTELKKNPDYKIQPLVMQTIKNDPIAFTVGHYIAKGAAATRNNGATLNIYYSKLEE